MDHSTGRLTSGLDPEIVELIFDKNKREQMVVNLPYCLLIDKAHIIMLEQCGLISADDASSLLSFIINLEKDGLHAEIFRLPTPRGWYLAYESYLKKEVGEVAGILHTARSRNDLELTIYKLKFREHIITVAHNLFSLVAQLSSKSSHDKDKLFVLHTQMQPAYPMSFGHYLQAIALVILERFEELVSLLVDITRECPLGACAAAGTSWKIDTKMTANFLGFEHGPENSIKAIASYDFAIKALATLNLLSISLTRFLNDLHLGLTQEFSFFELPDNLLGSSSIMPHKANTFVLEDAKYFLQKSISVLSYLTSAITRTPFTNMRECKLAVFEGFEGFEAFDKGLALFEKVLFNIKVKPQIFSTNNAYFYTISTALAEHIASSKELTFRQAHLQVGALVKQSIEQHLDFYSLVSSSFPEFPLTENPIDLFPNGGGFNLTSFTDVSEQIIRRSASARDRVGMMEQSIKESKSTLASYVKKALKPRLA